MSNTKMPKPKKRGLFDLLEDAKDRMTGKQSSGGEAKADQSKAKDRYEREKRIKEYERKRKLKLKSRKNLGENQY